MLETQGCYVSWMKYFHRTFLIENLMSSLQLFTEVRIECKIRTRKLDSITASSSAADVSNRMVANKEQN